MEFCAVLSSPVVHNRLSHVMLQLILIWLFWDEISERGYAALCMIVEKFFNLPFRILKGVHEVTVFTVELEMFSVIWFIVVGNLCLALFWILLIEFREWRSSNSKAAELDSIHTLEVPLDKVKADRAAAKRTN